MIKRTERGWAGHFCAALSCMFRRNTLLQSETESIVVSTVGNYRYNGAIQEIGYNRYYETMAFHSLADDKRYHDADVSKQVYFNTEWAINRPGVDDMANDMHEAVVAELMERMENHTIEGGQGMRYEVRAGTVYTVSNTGKPLCFSCALYYGPYQKCINSENLGSMTYCYSCQYYQQKEDKND